MEEVGRSSILQKLHMSLEELDLTTPHHGSLLVIQCDDTVASAFMLLSNHRLSAAPVVDVNGSIVGVFSASDVRKMPSIEEKSAVLAQDRRARAQSSATRVVQAFASLNKLDMKVFDYIQKHEDQRKEQLTNEHANEHANDPNKDAPQLGGDAITVTSNDTLQHVCTLLSTHSIHRVYIVDHLLRPYGVVSIADVLQAMRKHMQAF